MTQSLREWRERRRTREEGLEITLPSGLSARIRAVGVDTFLMSGHIPDSLTPIIAEAVNTGIAQLPELDTVQATRDYLQLLDALAKTAFVSPKVVDRPQADNEISPEDIDVGDKMWVLGFLGRPADALKSFRQEQTANVAGVGDAEGNPQTSIGNSGSEEAVETPEWAGERRLDSVSD